MTKPKISIIIPTPGDNPLLKDCLDSLRKQGLKHQDLQILIVTNRDLKKAGKAFSFSAAVNQAAKQATANYLLITNDDIVFKKNSLTGLLKTIELWPYALIGATIWDQTGKNPAPAGYTVNLWTGTVKPVYSQDNPVSCDWISGCCICLNKKIWNRLHGLDERFAPGMFEDADFCFRAKNSGYELLLSPDFQISHTQTSTFNRNLEKKYEYWYRNKFQFLKKHASPLQFALACLLQYALFTPARALLLRDGRFLPAIKGLFWNLKKS